MKKFITPIICGLLLIITILFSGKFTDFFVKQIVMSEPKVLNNYNQYVKDYSLSYAENTESFIPYSKQDIYNIIYTIINNGYENFTFYCPSEYELCTTDVELISNNSIILTHINNFVHPFNSFTNIRMTITRYGEVIVELDYLYDNDSINKINYKTDEIMEEILTDDMTDEEKIEILHDHIIENATYDISINNNNESEYNSSTAYGPLFEGYAICNGYSDLMAIYLNKLGIINIKIATTSDEISYSEAGHVWNAVNLDGKWYHIDLTWDDPIGEDEQEYLFHTYFLIDSNELYEIDNKSILYEEHRFSEVVYYEIE